LSPKPVYAERPDRGRRGSGSYYNVSSSFTSLEFGIKYS
jgi:hypothetical protein